MENVYTAAKELLLREGWTQGDLVNEQGRCVLGAMFHVLKLDSHEFWNKIHRYEPLYLGFRDVFGSADYASHNDNPETTLNDICDALDRAAKYEEMGYQPL